MALFDPDADSSQRRSADLFGDINALRNQQPSEDSGLAEKEVYNEKTCCGRLARNSYFEYVTLGVIVMNAVYLGIDCDYDARWVKPDDLYANPASFWAFIVMDNFFCSFFTFEVVIRFVGFKSKCSSCEKSFLFDLLLAALMILETWILAFIGPIPALKQLSILRLLRLARLMRMGKLLRYCPELKLIVTSLLAAVRSVGMALILLLGALYVFAIIFTQEYHQGLKKDDDPALSAAQELFGSMGRSMRHLLIMGTILDDLTACTNAIRASEKTSMLMIFWVCVIVTSLTLFNMMVGLLCEVVDATTTGEKWKAEEISIQETIHGFFKAMDSDNNGVITIQEFLKMHDEPEVIKALAKLDINEKHFGQYATLLFATKDKVEFKEASDLIMQLRPGRTISQCDWAVFKLEIEKANAEIGHFLYDLERFLEDGGAYSDGDDDDPDSPRSGKQSEGSEEKVDRDKAYTHNGKRTIASIAHHTAGYEVAQTPPICSKYQEAPKCQRARNAKKEETVKDHVQHLIKMRENMSNDLWKKNQLDNPMRTNVHEERNLRVAADIGEDSDMNNQFEMPPLLS